MKNKIIGISGLAGSGKDLFFKALSEKTKCKRFALADELKAEVKAFSLSMYGIDPVSCSGPQKELIRPLLVGHGFAKRNSTSGRYWIEKLNQKIKEDIFQSFIKNEENSLYCITDIRYNKFENDEVHWLKKEMNGILVHITKFRMKNRSRIYDLPPNKEEEEQNPLLLKNADYSLEWEHVNGEEENVKKFISPVINDFLKFIK